MTKVVKVEVAKFAAGVAVDGKTLGKYSKEFSGTVKEYVPSKVGEWVVVTDAAGEDFKTRPSLIRPAGTPAPTPVVKAAPQAVSAPVEVVAESAPVEVVAVPDEVVAA